MCRIDRTFLIIMLFSSLMACSNSKKCANNSNERLLQEYRASKEVLSLLQVDHGAFGFDVTLSICNSASNNLIEEIGLRGEDYLPKINSVVEDSVYIHYSFPRRPNEKNITLLDFESVVLGEALLDKRHLKYNYVSTNKAPQH